MEIHVAAGEQQDDVLEEIGADIDDKYIAALKKQVSSQEDVDEIIKELREYPVINEKVEYSEEKEDFKGDMIELGFTLTIRYGIDVFKH